MSIRSAVIGICLVLAGLCSAEEARPDAPSPQDLKLEVQALQTLYHFQFTPEQMQRLVKIAADTAPRPRPRKPAQVSEEYLQALTDLRNALVDATDEDRIDQLEGRIPGGRSGRHAAGPGDSRSPWGRLVPRHSVRELRWIRRPRRQPCPARNRQVTVPG